MLSQNLQMASSTDHGSLVVSSNHTSTMKTLFKQKRISSCQESDESLLRLPGSPEIIKELRSRHVRPHTKTKNPTVRRGGECYKALVRWATGKRLTNRLPKLSLITLSPPLNSGILGLRMGPYVPTPKFFYNLWGPRESDLSDS